MKGISLSIEVIVILAISVVVLAAILFALSRSIGPSLEDLELQKAMQSACQLWTIEKCDSSTSTLNRIKTDYIKSGRTSGSCSTINSECTLGELCEFGGYPNPANDPGNSCKKRCGCPI